MWGRLSPHPALEPSRARNARAFVRRGSRRSRSLLRANAEELIVAAHREDGRALARCARSARANRTSARAVLRRDRACAQSGLPSEVEEALWQLVAAGFVTADGFDALRSLIDAKRRLGEKGIARAPALVGRTLDAAAGRRPNASTREQFARRLLARWGVVFRDVIARESLAPPWRELLAVLRRMEARGEIRGGRFVAGFVGEQFALPEAVDALRAVRRAAPSGQRCARYRTIRSI